MDAEARREAAGLLADLRATLLELDEEGVEAPVSATAPAAEPARARSTEPAATRPAASGRNATPQQAAPPRQAPPATTSPPPNERTASSATPDAPPQAAPSWSDATTLDEVRATLGECTRCGLCEGRSTIVFGSGNPDADLMFIGEGPGEQEDRQGLPFVGRAGELLTQMIEKGLGISRDDVYICNIVKCRPPKNRDPQPDEVSACKPFLDGQIRAVKPKVIVSLGKPAASLLLGRNVAITRERGTWQSYEGIALMPTLHPAYVLRQYTPENRRLVWEDLKAALARCQGDG